MSVERFAACSAHRQLGGYCPHEHAPPPLPPMIWSTSLLLARVLPDRGQPLCFDHASQLRHERLVVGRTSADLGANECDDGGAHLLSPTFDPGSVQRRRARDAVVRHGNLSAAVADVGTHAPDLMPSARRPFSVISTNRSPPCSLQRCVLSRTRRRARSTRLVGARRQYGALSSCTSVHLCVFVSFAAIAIVYFSFGDSASSIRLAMFMRTAQEIGSTGSAFVQSDAFAAA